MEIVRQEPIEKPDFKYSVPSFPHNLEISQLRRNPKMVFLSLPLIPRGNMSCLWTLCVTFGILPGEVQSRSEAGALLASRAKLPWDVDRQWARGTSLCPAKTHSRPCPLQTFLTL